MSVTVSVNASEVVVGLGELRAGASNKLTMLKIAGELMRTSVARTFREEGSPEGSWPQLALSTLKKKMYVAGHQLLILSGRLFGSITYVAEGDTLTIGTNVVYAAVQQYGSRDRSGGTVGNQARIPGRGVTVPEHRSRRSQNEKRYGRVQMVDKNGQMRSIRVRIPLASRGAVFPVKEHTRYQNIPARPFLVFRPEDPGRIASGIEAYLAGKVARIGKTTGGAA